MVLTHAKRSLSGNLKACSTTIANAISALLRDNAEQFYTRVLQLAKHVFVLRKVWNKISKSGFSKKIPSRHTVTWRGKLPLRLKTLE